MVSEDVIAIVNTRFAYMNSSPHDLKVLTSEKDFKSELNATQNLMLAIGLSQKTVLHCTQEFVENDLANYEAAVQHVLQEVLGLYALHYLGMLVGAL